MSDIDPHGAPLAGTTVIAIEQYGAGPWATLQLADLGATVIKIEDPRVGGDIGRYVPPYGDDEDSLFFETFNRNKRSVSLDLRRPEAHTVLEDLVRGADAVFSNLRGDLPSKLGLTYDSLKHVNSRVVCCSLSGFGMTGPRAEEPAYDYIIQALAGWMMLTGAPADPPTKTGLSLVDLSSGYVAAIALLAGILRARREGTGCDCDISLFETALHQLAYVGTWVATARYEPRRFVHSAHPSIVPFQSFPTADDWIVIACPKQEFWVRLCSAIGRPELARDPLYATMDARNRNRDSLVRILSESFSGLSTATWTSRLTAARVPCAPVNTVGAALNDSQVVAREGIVETSHPRFRTVKQLRSPLRLPGMPVPRRAPKRGEDTICVLSELCRYDEEQIARLAEAGVFGDAEPPWADRSTGASISVTRSIELA